MRWIILAATVCIGIACGVAPQPESARTLAAFEVPLRSQAERERFLSVLRDVAEDEGMHVDAVSQEELERQAKVSPAFRKTLNATVWSGTNDDEPIASVMDQPDHLGQVWISFFRGSDPALNSKFRQAIMLEVRRRWPGTQSLPIMPTGAIPLHRDLIGTPDGYVVNPSEAHKYELHGGGARPQ